MANTGNYYANFSSSTTASATEPVWTRYYEASVAEKVKANEEKPMKKRRTGYEVGSRVIVTSNPQDHESLRGLVATVVYCSFPSLCIEFDEPIPHGHAGPDRGSKDNHCWNIDASFVKPIDGDVVYVIAADFEIGNKNVNGLEVNVLSTFNDGKKAYSIVEFGEDVGGHSGDGLGKRGHCWSLPSAILKMEKKKKKAKEKDK